MAEIGTDINKAVEFLNSGGLVGIPTETVYGLAANAFDEEAVTRVFVAKNRPSFDPLITHISDPEALESLVKEVPAKARILIEAFWPGPLTLVLPKSDKISDFVSSGLTTAAFRVPRHPMLLGLLEQLEFPIVAPSANPFGYVSPTSAAHVDNQLGEKIDYILDGGNSKIGLESTIIGFEGLKPVVFRQGGLSVEEIEDVIGEIAVNTSSSSKPSAPGMLISHYSPSKEVVLGDIEELINIHSDKKIGVLSFQKKYETCPNFVLSETGSVKEAATNLFSGLRWFDEQEVALVITEEVPNHGLGKAINDRLRRASTN